MSDERTVYSSEADRYERLISREDYQHNIEAALRRIVDVKGLDVIDLGAGTGRLSAMLAVDLARIFAFDVSRHMLALTHEKLHALAPGRGWVAVADHRCLPLPVASADLVLSGWSVSYLAVWDPEHWRLELDRWLGETMRVLRPGGLVVLLESLGTGNETPIRLPHLENFYPWLDEIGFENTWIRTDYRFGSVEEAAELAGFFFGDEMAVRIRAGQLLVLPECTGLWWKRLPA